MSVVSLITSTVAQLKAPAINRCSPTHATTYVVEIHLTMNDATATLGYWRSCGSTWSRVAHIRWDESDEKTSTCGGLSVGGYTASVLIYNRPETSTYHISPGDLDEGIKALVGVPRRGRRRAPGRGLRTGARFPTGVMDGAESCLRVPGVKSRAIHAGRGTAASELWPIQDGIARRTSAAPEMATLPSSSACCQLTSPRQMRVSVRRLGLDRCRHVVAGVEIAHVSLSRPLPPATTVRPWAPHHRGGTPASCATAATPR